MLRVSPTAGGFALCLAVPAFAQGLMYGPSNSTTGSAPSNDTSAMSCDQIMEKVKTMSIPGPGATMAWKQNEIVAARAAKGRSKLKCITSQHELIMPITSNPELDSSGATAR